MNLFISIDDHRSFPHCDKTLPPAQGEAAERGASTTAPLKEDAFYLVEIGSRGGPNDGPLRTVVRYWGQCWHGTDEHAYDDGPLPVDFAEYKVIREIDLYEDSAN